VKKITFAVLALIRTCLFEAPRIVAQDTASQLGAAAESSADSFSDQQMALLRKDIRSLKKQLIAANLALTDGEATKFWPVYEQYSAELAKINDARTALIKEYADVYGSLTDQQADSLIRRWQDTDIAASTLRQKYAPIFRTVLPGKKAATFFQLDDRPTTYVAAPTRAKPGLICPLSLLPPSPKCLWLPPTNTVTSLER
jgi:hypothetical protein